MAYDYSDLLAQAQAWLAQAQAQGWMGNDQQLADHDSQQPENLFSNGGSRPLIVAFMGGTGVGKSSLLNRLAGKAIAKAGVERPTSREVTLYHHRSVHLEHLAEQFPLAQIRIAEHDDLSKQHIIWIDMPDFDSVEQANRQLVLQWLPYVDVLVYVVSPERYRDEKAWKLLLAEGAKHAWLFALNQWDRGQAAQYQDFYQQLQKASFTDPLIFKTVCGEESAEDQFADLQSTLLSLANSHTIKQLEQRGVHIRKLALRENLAQWQTALGPEPAWQQLPTLWQQQWQKTSTQLQQGFAWPVQQFAKHYAEHAADLLNGTTAKIPLWDEWAQLRFDDALDELIISADQLGLPTLPVKQQLAPIRAKAAKQVRQQTEAAARLALASPGNPLQRGLLKSLRLLEISLPLLAMAWVGYQVFVGYYTSSQTNTHYLGVDFAIHSVLLIALTWLIPFFMLKKCQPSLYKTALRGLNNGLSAALSQMEQETANALANLGEQHQQQAQPLKQLITQCGNPGTQNLKQETNPALARMLVDD
ncbi:hypothetical protein JCM14076_29810 [Methylosoma difficile]